MTGIAIVLYLNQPPLQPRERDYAFAGSFYAFAIWVGMGVAALYSIISAALSKKDTEPTRNHAMIAACVALVIGLIVPLQVVSQTWDDHDRSGRFTTRDYGMNYLSSLDENAIIFTNGDNDTFPLWYAQEVEGFRTDVRVVNLSYLTTDWYVNQMRMPTYNAPGIDMQAKPEDYAYDRLQISTFPEQAPATAMPALDALKGLYASGGKVPEFPSKKIYIPVDIDASVEAGVIEPSEKEAADSFIAAELPGNRMTLSNAISLDMIATSAANGWNRPVYFAMTVPTSYYLGLESNLRNTGLAYQAAPIYKENNGYDFAVNTEKMYRNITDKFRWGGLDEIPEDGTVYLDETVRRMVTTHRSTMLDLATALYNEGVEALALNPDSLASDPKEFATDRFAKSIEILDLMEEKLPYRFSPYAIQIGQQIGDLYTRLGEQTGNQQLIDKGLGIIHDEILRWAAYEPYFRDLRRRGLYNNVNRSDRYATTYTVSLINTYYDAGGDINTLGESLDSLGIDISGILENAQSGGAAAQ